MFRAVPPPIIRSLFTVHSALVYVMQVWRQLSSRSICCCSKAVYKPVWHIQLLSVQWINSRRWTDELSETCRVSCQNKFVKLVHLVGFITKKFVTMHGHMNVKLVQVYLRYFPKFINFKPSLPPLQESTTSSCPEQIESHPQLHTIQHNIKITSFI